MTIDYKKLAAEAAEMTDHTETTSGGDFERRVIPEGVTIGRFVEYVELGKQPQFYQGKETGQVLTARLGFELLHPKKNMHEIEVNGEKVTVSDRHYEYVTVKLGEKARFKKLMKAMTYGRDGITHMAQMLNEPFVLTFKHNKSQKDGKEVVYSNLYNDGAYGIQPPKVDDPITGESKEVPVPEATQDIKIFLWDNPTKETWDSLYIAGTRTVKDPKGKETEVSKNWLQEKILEARDFSGSSLEDMLTGSEELTKAVDKAEAQPKAAVTEKVAAKKAEPKAEKVKTKAKKAEKTETEEEDEDPLAALGLN